MGSASSVAIGSGVRAIVALIRGAAGQPELARMLSTDDASVLTLAYKERAVANQPEASWPADDVPWVGPALSSRGVEPVLPL
jgi:hypothetical protein